jgi:pimeloyl-ACP methyl ester carboxylesterase
MATEHDTTSSIAARPRDDHGGTSESLRERLLTGLPVTEWRLSLNGVTTAVLEGGEGRPVVLLHGPGDYGAHWLSVIPSLARTHRIVAPDLPGHGESGMFESPPEPGLLSGWLDDLIECTCAIPPVLVGSTLGGAIAARFASERGERLAGLVLVDALGLTEFRPTPEFGAALTAYLSAPEARTHDRLWGHCVFDLPALRTRMGNSLALIRAYNLDRIAAPGRLAALHSLMQQFGAPAIPLDVLARIAVPTTLIWGRHDRATPLSIAEETSRRLGWDLRIIDDAADDPALEQPEAFMAALHAALTSKSGIQTATSRRDA